MFDFILTISSRSVHLLRRRNNDKSLFSKRRGNKVVVIVVLMILFDSEEFFLLVDVRLRFKHFSFPLLVRCHNNFLWRFYFGFRNKKTKHLIADSLKESFGFVGNEKTQGNQLPCAVEKLKKISFRISISMMAGSRYRKWKYLLRSAARENSIIKFTFHRSTSDNWIRLRAMFSQHVMLTTKMREI